jgi:hypothetical protein
MVVSPKRSQYLSLSVFSLLPPPLSLLHLSQEKLFQHEDWTDDCPSLYEGKACPTVQSYLSLSVAAVREADSFLFSSCSRLMVPK